MQNKTLVDTLESRRMFANVALSFVAGQLNLLGSTSGDAITVSANATTLSVKGGAGTTINGSAAAQTFPKFAVTTIFANLGNGNDAITLNNVDQGLGGTLDTGAGNDFVALNDSVLASALVTTGAGNDAVALLNTRMQNVTIDTGDNADFCATYGNTIFGFSAIVMGAGDDTVLVAKSTVFGFTSVFGGTGRDIAIGFGNNLVGGRFVAEFEYALGTI